ncbi:kinase-regulated stress-responsive transcription factor skn7, partial [Ascosphaera atra]
MPGGPLSSDANAQQPPTALNLNAATAAAAESVQLSASVSMPGRSLAQSIAPSIPRQPLYANANGPRAKKNMLADPGWMQQPHILLVEDDITCRQIGNRFLCSFNCLVDTAYDGIEAVKKLHSGYKYDLILMDIIMPLLDGTSACDMIRRMPDRTPIVAMTSNIRQSDIEKYFRCGMNDVLPKPFAKESLLSMLRKHLAHLIAPSADPLAAQQNNKRPSNPGPGGNANTGNRGQLGGAGADSNMILSAAGTPGTAYGLVGPNVSMNEVSMGQAHAMGGPSSVGLPIGPGVPSNSGVGNATPLAPAVGGTAALMQYSGGSGTTKTEDVKSFRAPTLPNAFANSGKNNAYQSLNRIRSYENDGVTNRMGGMMEELDQAALAAAVAANPGSGTSPAVAGGAADADAGNNGSATGNASDAGVRPMTSGPLTPSSLAVRRQSDL